MRRAREVSASPFQEILLDAGAPVLVDLFVDRVIDRDVDLVRGRGLTYGAGRRSCGLAAPSRVSRTRYSGHSRFARAAGHRMAVPAFVLYEWLRGPRLEMELAVQEAELPSAEAIAFGHAEARTAAELYRRLPRARGPLRKDRGSLRRPILPLGSNL